jgi:hypothetical protein
MSTQFLDSGRLEMAEPFRFANGQLAYTVDDLLKVCQQFPQDSINYLVKGDFERWLDYLGEKKLAQKAKAARQAKLSDQERLQIFLKSEQIFKFRDDKTSLKMKGIEKITNQLTTVFQSLKKLFSR